LFSRTLHAWGAVATAPEGVDFSAIRQAIRDEEKLFIHYGDEQARQTQRAIWPLALIYYSDAAVVVGWCELRAAIRNFRTDRIAACTATGAHFRNQGDAMRQQWIAGWKTSDASMTTGAH
jgi:predicted DNA-binding transcriptional regulator YafY